MLMSLGNKMCEYDCNKRHNSDVARCSQAANGGVVNTGSCCDLSDFHFPECSARHGKVTFSEPRMEMADWSGVREMYSVM